MLLHLAARSLWHRRWALALAGLVVVLGAGLVSALVNLTPDVAGKAGGQLRSYGANLIILPQPLPGEEMTGYLEEARLTPLEGEREAIVGYVPFLYSLGTVAGRRVVLVGTRMEGVQKLNPWWQVQGSWPTGEDEALVGTGLARKLGLAAGQIIPVDAGRGERPFKIAGLVATGSAEEEQVVMPLAAAQELAGRQDRVSLVQVNAWGERGEPLSALAQRLEQSIPGAEVRVVGQVAQAEAQVLAKVKLIMLLVAALVLATAGLAIFSVMTTSFLERTREIGLMKALGASDGGILVLFAAEVSLAALGGGLLGFLWGYGMAQAITLAVFAAPAASGWGALGLTLGVAVAVAFLGSFIPVCRALRLDPAITLREE